MYRQLLILERTAEPVGARLGGDGNASLQGKRSKAEKYGSIAWRLGVEADGSLVPCARAAVPAQQFAPESCADHDFVCSSRGLMRVEGRGGPSGAFCASLGDCADVVEVGPVGASFAPQSDAAVAVLAPAIVVVTINPAAR